MRHSKASVFFMTEGKRVLGVCVTLFLCSTPGGGRRFEAGSYIMPKSGKTKVKSAQEIRNEAGAGNTHCQLSAWLP